MRAPLKTALVSWAPSINITIIIIISLNLATPPLPPQTKLNLEHNGWKWVLFLATTLLGEVGGRRNELKAEQNIVISRVLRNNCLEGLFHTVPSPFVFHCLPLSGPTRDESHVCSGTWTGSTNVSLHSLQARRTRIQKGSFRRRRCHLLSHWLGMKFLADNTLAENRANCLPASRALSQWYVHTQGDRSTHGSGESSFS